MSEGVSPARRVAYSTLSSWREGQEFLEDLLEGKAERAALSREDRRLAQALAYGVTRRLRLLDFWIDSLSSKGLASLPAPVADIERIALFQLAFLERIPAHAVVHEAVAQCSQAGVSGLKGVVNATLRNFSRKRAELEKHLELLPNRLGIETSHPDWLVDWAADRWGLVKSALWLNANNEIPSSFLWPLSSRLLKSEELERAPEEKGRSAAKRLVERLGIGELSPEGEAVVLPAGTIPGDLPAFREGLAEIQDPAAREAVKLLDPQPGEKVLDLCCAPGGKTLQIADKMRGLGELVAVDSSADRLVRVRENLERCGFPSVEVLRRDLLEPWGDWEGRADALLLDAPCSGLGTLRRRVDLRYRITPNDFAELAERAAQLLGNAARLVRPGGRLVYSTCTLSAQENEAVIAGFLEGHSHEWRLIRSGYFPPWLAPGEIPAVPSEAPGSDASYSALLLKTPIRS
ncbi:MAG: Ribosomal RNA small subunit methyltransferase B [bacterium]|nr:Ribosomal RNA small subunit methyltransferase B [bacterium]